MTWSNYIYSRERLLHESLKLLKGLWPTIADGGARMMGIRFNNIRAQPNSKGDCIPVIEPTEKVSK